MERMLFVPTASDVERKDAASLRRIGDQQVVAREKRHNGEALHRHRQVATNHHREPICLTLKGKCGSLKLFVVLEFDLEQPYELDREAGGAGDANTRMLIGLEDLLDVACGDENEHRCAAVTRHHDAAIKGDRHNRCAVWCINDAGPEGATSGHHVGCMHAEKVGERPDSGLMKCGRKSA